MKSYKISKEKWSTYVNFNSNEEVDNWVKNRLGENFIIDEVEYCELYNFTDNYEEPQLRKMDTSKEVEVVENKNVINNTIKEKKNIFNNKTLTWSVIAIMFLFQLFLLFLINK